MDWKDQINESLKTLGETVTAQNEIIIKMSSKVDLMWKTFLGVFTVAGLFLLERILNVL